MQVRYQMTEDEYVEAQLAHEKAAQGKLLWVFRFGAIVVAIAGIRTAWLTPGGGLGYILLTSGIALFVYWTWMRGSEARRRFAREAQRETEITLDINEDQVFARTTLGQASRKWEGYLRFAESEGLFFLYWSPTTFQIVPKRCLAPGEVDGLRELLRRKLPASKS